MQTYNAKLEWLRPHFGRTVGPKEEVYIRVILWSVERIARALESHRK